MLLSKSYFTLFDALEEQIYMYLFGDMGPRHGRLT